MRHLTLALILPAYNEAEVIGSVLSSLPKKVDDIAITRVVVNDASTDDTSKIARKSGAVVLDQIINTDSGGATATGLAYARDHNFDYAVTIDADGQHAASDCEKVIRALAKDHADLIIGSRLMAQGQGMPWHRVLGNRGLSIITYLLFGLYVTDSQSGLKGFSRRALETVEIKTSGKEFCSEIIWRAKQKRLKVIEVPIQAIYSSYSLGKGQSNWNAVNIIKDLLKRKVLELIDA